jgi:glycosyltransferase involved in cell wall biosynthesis
MSKICLVVDHPFWYEFHGAGYLLRSRYDLFCRIFDTVSVIFLTNTDTKCPYQGITIKSDFNGSKWINILNNYVKSNGYDYCYFSYNYYSEVAETLPCLSIVEIHDVIHLRNESFTNFGYRTSKTEITKSQELSTLAEYDFVVCISQTEYKYLQINNLQNVVFLPPFIQAKESVKHSQNGKYGFFGGTQLPNIDALKQLPQSLLYDERFLIGGSITTVSEVDELLIPPENNLGLLENSNDFYSKVNLLLSPIRFGSGLKIKVLEALSFGLPILCTQHSVEGYPPGIGDIVKVHNEPNEWNHSIIDEALNLKRGHILEYCKENFGYDRLRKQIMQIF